MIGDSFFKRENGVLGIIGDPGTGVNYIGHLYLKSIGFEPSLIGDKSNLNEYHTPNPINMMRCLVQPDYTLTYIDPVAHKTPMDIFHCNDILYKNGWVNQNVRDNLIKQVLFLDTSKIDKSTQMKIYKLFYMKRRLSNNVHNNFAKFHNKKRNINNLYGFLCPELYQVDISVEERIKLTLKQAFDVLSSPQNLDLNFEVKRFYKFASMIEENYSPYISPMSLGCLTFFLNTRLITKDKFVNFVSNNFLKDYNAIWGSLSTQAQQNRKHKVLNILVKHSIPFKVVNYYDVYYYHKDTDTFIDDYKQETSEYTKANKKIINLFDEWFINENSNLSKL